MIFPNIDPVFLRLGPLEFRWYGLMYICGFVASYFIILSGVRRKGLPLNKDQVADLIFTVAVGVILGGRLGYILFYNFSYYLSHPLKLFAVWEGGMSFHGGLIGALLASLYFIRKFKLRFYPLADIGFLAAPVGLGFGRIGNFINGELYGRVTDVPWGIVFPTGGPLPRHPSQLYEAFLEGPLMFLILYQLSKRVHRDGVVVWSFIALYGLFRFLVEFVRQPDEQIGFLLGGFSMGQMLSLPMFLLGAAMVCYRCRRG
ncbi:prolipoprotein diacylglyceryl transferase [Geomonas nitrogeniifigens]|uniref:Phosphatidylglycerol--prolipoprotein diacylglyceryl transferase n=1 Tax=Geomonas diazotrophica TaxID=2843197 RepID=A0ABX8JML5_9BACT|nr:prolipoprotein diacylglyceryl transferase [Geomonas nitrogeniifigens]QWV98983.1 prolipoprotein diacylglyceryl transferase [Geomonas nitrogeniifigens]QXE88149.1 prolipoprotein diacylglyceryl transferase [Geomonas nitrogeniifigens]